MGADVKNVLANIHERASLRRSTMQANYTSKPDELSKSNNSPPKKKKETKINGKALNIKLYFFHESITEHGFIIFLNDKFYWSSINM